jgi:hypothetical protein
MKKMKKKILTVIVALFYLCSFPFSGFSQNNVSKSATMTLTVKEVAIEIDPFSVRWIKVIDEKGNSISLSINKGNRFENATVESINMPKDTQIKADTDGNNYYFVISNTAKLLFEYKVNGKIYPIGVGVGSKFIVKKTAEGKYILQPEETAKISPPPQDV